MQATRIASLNINGATAAPKLDMLTDFLYCQEITIILLQEVTHNDVERIRGYDTYLNIWAMLRDTALAVRKTTRIQQVQRLTSGRAITATYGDLRIVNIYAPSGTSNRVERKHFYNSELPSIMRHAPGILLLGGDFNCTQTAAETTEQPCPIRALSELIRRMGLKGTWSHNYNQPVYTHYTHTGASRLHRIYASSALLARKVKTMILPVPFSDHQTVILSINMGGKNVWRVRRDWRMNPAMLRDECFMMALHDKWKEWQRTKPYYPNVALW
jgi:hypothetical protein